MNRLNEENPLLLGFFAGIIFVGLGGPGGGFGGPGSVFFVLLHGFVFEPRLSQQRTLTEGGFLLSCSYLCLCQVEFMVTF